MIIAKLCLTGSCTGRWPQRRIQEAEVTGHYNRLRTSTPKKGNDIGVVTLLFAIGFLVLFVLILLYSNFSG
jgi:hypothetical protein